MASVAAGEAAGRLPDVLSRLAELQRSEIRNRATIRTLLAYPIVAVDDIVVGRDCLGDVCAAEVPGDFQPV